MVIGLRDGRGHRADDGLEDGSLQRGLPAGLMHWLWADVQGDISRRVLN
ncbi:MAG: hypothetical protein ACRERW_10055 [Pseudomonas sp.]